MLASRWSHLVRYGLLGSSLLGAARPANAEPCDQIAGSTIAFVLGVQISPSTRIIGGIEGRKCLDDRIEALARLELGGGAPRFIVGARARPFESPDRDSDLELVGVEAGGVLDTGGKLGVHVAGTYGTHSAYLAIQGRVKLGDDESATHWSLLGGLAPWTLSGGSQTVEGRPLAHAGQLLRPRIVRELAALRSAEARAARAHFVESAQLELSSVWTFMRLAAELAAVGAPAALIISALDAADDEVRHAMACAHAAGGLALAALSPSLARRRFSMRSAAALATLAVEAWYEGCLNETAAAEEARIVSESTSGDRRTMLGAIARDEARHAELSWSVLAWLYTVAPDITRAAIAALPTATPSLAPVDFALARHGVPTEQMTAAARNYAARTAKARLADLAG